MQRQGSQQGQSINTKAPACRLHTHHPLNSLRPAEERAVNSINNRLRTDLSAAEEASIETFDGILPSLHAVELQVDVTLGVGVKSNVDYMPILLLTLGTDVVLKLLDPGFSLLPGVQSALFLQKGEGGDAYSVGLNILRSSTHLLAWLTLTGSGFDSVFGLAIFCL